MFRLVAHDLPELLGGCLLLGLDIVLEGQDGVGVVLWSLRELDNSRERGEEYDVDSRADILFFATLATACELPGPNEDDTQALVTVRNNVESQRKTATEQLEKFVYNQKEHDEHIAAMKVMCCSSISIAWEHSVGCPHYWCV